MTRNNKTWKDQKDRKQERGVKEEPRKERGGHHNLIREVEEEALEELEEWLMEEEDA